MKERDGCSGGIISRISRCVSGQTASRKTLAVRHDANPVHRSVANYSRQAVHVRIDKLIPVKAMKVCEGMDIERHLFLKLWLASRSVRFNPTIRSP
jgi:hypothetical protein